MGHASALQRPSHGDGGPLSQEFKLNDFGGNLHNLSLCASAQKSSTALGALAQREAAYLCGILGLMAKTATERHAHYRHHVAAYLRAVEIARGWSQSEIARQVGVLSTTINKALKLKHSMDYTTLLALEAASDIPIHEELRQAAATLKAPRQISASEAETFLQSSPEWTRMVELGRQLSAATDPKAKRELKREISQLLSKVA
jgi:transcriptional regulator with XRE-family HTH domain